MSAALRRVRLVRLRAPDHEHARHAAVQLEDALRTASIPGADGAAILVVRSLRLQPFTAAAPPATLALAIEERMRELAGRAVHAAAPDACAAPVVYFRDDAEPLILLALRNARGVACSEWFWPRVLPGLPAGGRDEMLRFVLHAAPRTSAGPAAGVRLVRELVRAGAADPLAAALGPRDGEPLLAAFGWRPPVAARAAPAALVEPAAEDLLGRWAGSWPSGDARTIWLACALVAAPRPAAATDPGLPAAAAALARELTPPRRVRGPDGAARGSSRGAAGGTEPGTGAARGAGEGEPSAARRAGAGEAGAGAAAGASGQEAGAGGAAGASLGGEAGWGEHPAPAWWRPPTRPSANGGFVFLVALLERLGVARLLAERPELRGADWVVHLLRVVAAALRVPDDDPALAAVPGLVTETGTPPRMPPELRPLSAAWLRGMRGYCRRADLGIAALVRRPARVALTPTHVDVYFEPRQADIRIRRAGLDVDPGWVPWLGRVVTFHYAHDDADAND